MSDIEILLGEVRVMRAEWREDVSKLHSKIEEVHTQTTKTNGRVTRLEESHKICPVADIEKRVQNIESRETEEYKTGKFLKTAAIVCGWIVGISLVGSGVLGIVVYIKDTL